MSGNKLSLQTNEGWYLVVGFGIAIMAAAAVALASYNDITRYYNRVDWVTHTEQVLTTLDASRGDTFASLAALQNYFQSGDRKKLDQLAARVFQLQRNSRGGFAPSLRTTPRSSAASIWSTSPRGAWPPSRTTLLSQPRRYAARTHSARRFLSSSAPTFTSSARNSTRWPWLNKRY